MRVYATTGLAAAMLVLTLATVHLGQEPGSSSRLASYVLGPGDEIQVMSSNAANIVGTHRISTDGYIALPMVERVSAAGKTVEALEAEIRARLSIYYRQPDVAISVVEFRGQPVSVVGSVGTSGTVQLEGRKTLVEVLTQVGGLASDAGPRITITRPKESGPIPLVSGVREAGDNWIAEVSSKVMEGSNPEENILILPYDTISVPRAQIIWVIGEVPNPGGHALRDNARVSVRTALAYAGGPGPAAAAEGVIFRTTPDGEEIQIPVNIRDIWQGKIVDGPMLEPEDQLLVQHSLARGGFRSVLNTALQAATGMVIYRRW